jgi:hypothetical protein
MRRVTLTRLHEVTTATEPTRKYCKTLSPTILMTIVHGRFLRETRHVFQMRSIPYFIQFLAWSPLTSDTNLLLHNWSPAVRNNFPFTSLNIHHIKIYFKQKLQMPIMVFWVVTQCGLVSGYQNFGLTLKIEAIPSSKTMMVSTDRTTQGHNPMTTLGTFTSVRT